MKNRKITAPDFQLIETLRWTPAAGYHLLELHLARLQHSASDLGFTCDLPRIHQELERNTHGYPRTPQRVRLLLYASGHTQLTAHTFEWPAAHQRPVRCVLSGHSVNSHDFLLRHKTTRRTLFDDEHRHFRNTVGAGEVLFSNEQGHMTEGSRNTLFVRIDGQLLTPPLASGLLDGVLRRHLLQTRPDTREAVLQPQDLINAEQVLIGNSLRGLQSAVFCP